MKAQTPSVAGRKMAFSDVQKPTPRSCKHIPLHGKIDFADVIKLKTLIWGDYVGLSGWILCNHKTVLKSRSRQEVRVIAGDKDVTQSCWL